jgi:hypothetical protein
VRVCGLKVALGIFFGGLFDEFDALLPQMNGTLQSTYTEKVDLGHE